MINLRKLYTLFLTVLCVLIMSGCVATQEDVGGLYARQNKLEARMERLSQEMDVIKKKNFGVDSGSANAGDQIFQLQTKVDDLERNISDIDSGLSSLQNDVQKLNKRVSTVSSQAQSLQKNAAAKSQQKTEEVSTAPKEPELNDFDKGYRNLGEGKYKLAREQFNSYIKNNPDSTKVPDSVFWIADSYYRQGNYEEAILAYQKLIDSYPKDSRVPLAYLKQGLSLRKLDKKDEAKLFFETLVDKYPDSEEAQQAKKNLEELEAEE